MVKLIGWNYYREQLQNTFDLKTKDEILLHIGTCTARNAILVIATESGSPFVWDTIRIRKRWQLNRLPIVRKELNGTVREVQNLITE